MNQVLDILDRANLTVKKTKCQFVKRDLQFLGHTLSQGKINPQQAKIKAVTDFVKPTTKKELRSFLGLTSFYRKFVPQFATIAAPLFQMTKQDAPTKLTWTEETLRAMDTLKKSITSAPALISADPEQPYLLQTDASDVGLGAVLAQERDGLEHPIAFYSRALNKAERNYTTTEKECLAVVERVKAFGIILARCNILCDH